MSYVLQRTTDRRFVAPPGREPSYVRMLQHARIFSTRAAAERERCPENERALSLDEACDERA